MRIVEQSDERLVIEHRPWLLAGIIWVLGLAALYAGVTGQNMRGPAEHLLVLALGIGTTFAAWYWFAFLRITFDRAQGRVEHRSLRPFGSRSKYLDLAKVRQARVEFTRTRSGGRLRRLVLDTPDGVAALEYGFASGDRAALAAEVNAWLAQGAGAAP